MVTTAQRRRLFKELNKVDPVFVKKILPFMEGLYKYYFRVDIDGFENVPPEGPKGKALFVGNHNGLLTFEVLMLFYAWWDRFGSNRGALGLAHAVSLNNPFFNWIVPRIGAIPADPEVAFEAMERGYSLLVYPGGEKESFRTYAHRKKVEFYGRKGFIRLALRSKVPIVPIVSIGAHESYVILHRGEEIAEKLGLKEKYRLHGVPLTFRGVFFLWCLATGIFSFFPLLIAPFAFISIFIPLPAKMTFKILPAIDVCGMYDNSKSEEENLEKIYTHVTGHMQQTLDVEYAKRRFPIVG